MSRYLFTKIYKLILFIIGMWSVIILLFILLKRYYETFKHNVKLTSNYTQVFFNRLAAKHWDIVKQFFLNILYLVKNLKIYKIKYIYKKNKCIKYIYKIYKYIIYIYVTILF